MIAIKEFSIVRERRHVTPCLSSAPSNTGYCERRHRSVDNVKSVGLEFKIWVGSFRLYVDIDIDIDWFYFILQDKKHTIIKICTNYTITIH